MAALLNANRTDTSRMHYNIDVTEPRRVAFNRGLEKKGPI
jgi:hypothetical protein